MATSKKISKDTAAAAAAMGRSKSPAKAAAARANGAKGGRPRKQVDPYECTDLDSLLNALQDPRNDFENGDYSDLPTFGGPDLEAEECVGVWSWDAERLLVGESRETLEIVDRS